MAESLRFQTNIPEIVALKFADGLAVSSKFSGDQIMFTLTDDRKMYVPPVVADKIAAAGICAGEVFEICKREVKVGNRRTVEYQIVTAAPSHAAGEHLSSSLQSLQPTVKAPQTPTPTPQSYSGNAARSLHEVPKAATASAPTPSADSSAVALMKIAGCGAIDAVLEVEGYAQARGMTDFAFGADNIQKIAACLFIELCKKAGRS